MTVNTSYFHPVFHPTKVAIIDDDSDYLEQVSLVVNDNVVCSLFTSPSQAIEVIRQQDERSKRLAAKCSAKWDLGMDAFYFDKSGNQSRGGMNDHNRFDRFSVVVIDYAMPEMNGLEFCNMLDDPWIKKILITGKADAEVAVRAFNEGMIDRFIRKEEEGMDVHLNAAIEQLSHRYFADICSPDNPIMLRQAPYLLENEFIDWFKSLCHELDIVEYYLAHNPVLGEFLLIDRDGYPRILLLQTPEHARAQLEVAQDEEQVPAELLHAIAQRQLIPYIRGRCAYDETYRFSWREHAYVPQRVGGYAYVVLEPSQVSELGVERLEYSYSRYLRDFYDRGELI